MFFKIICNNYKKQKKIFFSVFLGLLFLGYFFLIWSNFSTTLSRISLSFGYMDYHHHWQILDAAASLKMPFVDYYHWASYGWFYLLIQSIPYLIFGKTFFALLVVRHLYLPLLALIISYLVAKNVLNKQVPVTIFLFFCLLFGVNYIYESPRHLVAELSLSFLILFFSKKKERYLLISGMIAGLAVLTSFEYGLAVSLAVFLVFLTSLFLDTKFIRLFLNRFLLGETIILAPYFLWLYFKGVFGDYWGYTITGITNFYFTSPASGDSFPRLTDIKILTPGSKLLFFGLPIEFLQKLNLYIVFCFFLAYALVLFTVFIKKRKFRDTDMIKLSLVFYGLIIFIRTIDTPATGYSTYGLIPFFLLLTLAIEKIFLWICQKKPLILKLVGFLIVAIIFFWFILTENTGYVIKVFGKQEKQLTKKSSEEIFYPPVGWQIQKDLAEKYTEISDFIATNTTDTDFLYVYPWGPYNYLSGRKSSSSFPLPKQFFRKEILEELQLKNPKYVIVNIYNNLGIAHYGKTRGDVIRYYSLEYEDGPVFAGEGNIIEKYILENYKTVFENDLAIVMGQRQESAAVGMKKKEIFAWRPRDNNSRIKLQFMEAEEDNGKYKIIGENASWAVVFDKPIETLEVAVEFKLDGDFFTKHLSRYFINLCAFNKEGEKLGAVKVLSRKILQTDKIYFNQSEDVEMVKIEIKENAGLVWWLRPYKLEIGRISLF